MHFTKLQLTKPNERSAAQLSASRKSSHDGQGHSVGEQLRAALGERYSIHWLATQLDCTVESAEALDGWWLVPSPHGRIHGLAVFSRMLGVDLQRLLEVFAQADAASAKPAAVKPRGETTVASKPAPERRRLVTIGSNDGVREVRQAQPTVVYRKVRQASTATA